jgi:hypothetical protein
MVFRAGHHPWNDFDRRENLREVSFVLTDAADVSLCARTRIGIAQRKHEARAVGSCPLAKRSEAFDAVSTKGVIMERCHGSLSGFAPTPA